MHGADASRLDTSRPYTTRGHTAEDHARPCTTREYTDEERRILQHHVTNLDRDVYAVFNLPPEVVAVVFAYVSRSPASFRDNLLKLVLSGDVDMHDVVSLYSTSPVDLSAAREKAREFHERVTVGYGHSSVAELSTLAIGCERISRLASAELELANRWLSFIEFSQRYQRPRRGGYVVPPELHEAGDEDVIALFCRTQDAAFDVYEQLLQGLLPHLRQAIPRRDGESDRRFERRIEKIAFEDARYALTLAVHTNLGVTGNARAFRDAIVRLLSDPYRETTRLAEAIREEGQKICPTLIRYADPNPYQQGVWAAFGSGARPGVPDTVRGGRYVRLVDWTGRSPGAPAVERPILSDTAAYLQPCSSGPSTGDEVRALRRILSAAWTAHGHPVAEDDLAHLDAAELMAHYDRLLAGLGPHDHPADALRQVSYLFELSVSEANWHQLLRHCRQIDFAAARPSVDGGVTVPPLIADAGLTDVLLRAVDLSETAYRRIAQVSPTAAHYVVTNAHNRRVLARVTLWEMFHLVNLRGKPDAQWDIRQTVLAMRDAVRRVHPHLLRTEREPAKVAAHAQRDRAPG